MFFLKKLISAFLEPSTVCVLLLATGLALLWFTRRQRPGKILVVDRTGAAAAVQQPVVRRTCCWRRSRVAIRPCTPPSGCRRPPTPPGRRRLKFVVVLAGGHVADPRVPLDRQLGTSALARVIEGIRLHRQLPGSKLMLSGGLAAQRQRPARRRAGRGGHRVWGGQPGHGAASDGLGHRGGGRDHHRQLVGKQPFILVTSASHMPRSLALFRRRGGQPIAAPTFLSTLDEPGVSLSSWFPSPDALNESDAGLHEYLGILWSNLRGRM